MLDEFCVRHVENDSDTRMQMREVESEVLKFLNGERGEIPLPSIEDKTVFA